MNRQILAKADPHIQEEWARLRELNKTVDRAVQLCSEAIAQALRGEKVTLPGMPTPEAEAIDWHGYFIGQAAKVRAEEAAK